MNADNSVVIEKAKEIFAEQHLDPSQYEISVVKEKDSLTVIFLDKNEKINSRGNRGVLPGFEVKFDANDLRVLEHHFIR